MCVIKSKAAFLKDLGNWTYGEINIPNPNLDQTIVKIIACGICSTDVVRSFGVGFYFYPIVPGHEMLGIVHKVGGKSFNIKEGDKVAVYPLITKCDTEECCGYSSDPNLCSKYDFLGSRSNGGYSEYVLAPTCNLVKIPDSLTGKLGVLTEPMAVALHALKKSNYKNSENILICGLGPIGILVAHWCKINSIKNVCGLDRNDIRFKNFKDTGYNNIINTNKDNINEKLLDYTEKKGFDIIFECSGSEELFNFSITALKKKGQLVVLSNQIQNINLSKKTLNALVRYEINIQGAWSSLIKPKDEWSEAIEGLVEIKNNLNNFISHDYKLSESREVFYRMHKKAFPFSKVILTP